MRPETKILKSIMKLEFPQSTVHVQFKPTRNYVDSSDKLVLTITNAVWRDILTTLQHYTRNVSICLQGELSSRGGICSPSILNPETKAWVSLDCCEFIEVHIK